MKAIETSAVRLISKQHADEILFNCMTATPKIDTEILVMSTPFKRPGIEHDLYIGQDLMGQMYLRCETLDKDQWSSKFGNGV